MIETDTARELRAMLRDQYPEFAAGLELAITVLALPAPVTEPRTGHTCHAGPLCASWYGVTYCRHPSCYQIMTESCTMCQLEAVGHAIELARRVRAGEYHGTDAA